MIAFRLEFSQLGSGNRDRTRRGRVIAFDGTFQFGAACRWKTGSER
jgi:hypothetical protein